MPDYKSCGSETGKKINLALYDGNEFYISYERGAECPEIYLNNSYFCNECLDNAKASDWAWKTAAE